MLELELTFRLLIALEFLKDFVEVLWIPRLQGMAKCNL